MRKIKNQIFVASHDVSFKQRVSFISSYVYKRIWDRSRHYLSKKYHIYLYLLFALFLLTALPVIIYYSHYPQVELNADTPQYLSVAEKMWQYPFHIIDTWRLPGYPFFIVTIYHLAGYKNLAAVSTAQAILFILMALEVYWLSCILLRNAWLALAIGLLVGTNLVLLSYVKLIMSEGLAQLELATLALLCLHFIYRPRKRSFLLVMICLFLLSFTRPEWLYIPIPLCIYLLLVAKQLKAAVRPLLRPAIVSIALFYMFVGCYIGLNARINHYPGLTGVENFNWMGKVLQYNMQDEVKPEYQAVREKLDYYVKSIDTDPYHILYRIPELSNDTYRPAGAYARSIIVHHPVEFFVKSVPMFFASLTCYYEPSRMGSTPAPLGPDLAWLHTIHRLLYNMNICSPFCTLLWISLLFWPKMRAQRLVWMMNLLILITFYALVVTTIAGYRLDDYMRFHIVFDPLLIVIVWGTIFAGLLLLIKGVSSRFATGNTLSASVLEKK